MVENILVCVAWPYASASIHVGNITGSHLPADIFARYNRLKGNHVRMVSGSDSHGTPVTVKAEAEDSTPLEIYQCYHNEFLDLFQKLGINYDLYTSTHTQNHFKVSQSIFLALKENGYLYEETQEQWYSESEDRFLPDRYVEGTCYICGYERARGDQCENCGTLLDATQLIDPRTKTDGSTPVLRETTHLFLDLSKLEKQVIGFLEEREDYWRANVINQSLGWIKAKGLQGRPITRDLSWGIPVPVEGWEDKCLYVWFEAVIGYLSATVECTRLAGDANGWHDFWYNPDAKASYFIGKDNIPFHAIMWPAQLEGAGKEFARIFEEEEDKTLTLPYNVPANEFMNMEDRKISGSANWAVWGLDFLSRYDPDPLRFYLTINMPENRDSNWDWDDFVRRNNDDLVATWGNLANRVLSFSYKNWEGVIPTPGELRPLDKEILETVEKGFETVGGLIEEVKLRAALLEAMRLASEVNKYLDTTAPWSEIKTDREAAATTVYTALKAIDSLKVLFSPFLPHTSEQLHAYFGYAQPLSGEQVTETVSDNLGEHTVLRYNQDGAIGEWKPSQLEPGHTFLQPKPLYRKLDPDTADQERNRLA
ncbi:MAG: methionine--tRNA ligase [Anaerolineales bacterium]|nr:methionine--tRNA ligase [Anaerolineales bacterium]